MNYPRCKTCEWWDGTMDGEMWRPDKCSNESVYGGDLRNEAFVVGPVMIFSVGPDFGCVHHKERSVPDTNEKRSLEREIGAMVYTGPNFGCVHHEPKEGPK